jgi:hypothetical protein
MELVQWRGNIVDDVSAGDLRDNYRIGGTWSDSSFPKAFFEIPVSYRCVYQYRYDYNVASLGYPVLYSFGSRCPTFSKMSDTLLPFT